MGNWKAKMVFVALGLAIAAAGLSTKIANLENAALAFLLFVGGLILLGEVVWAKLFNKKYEIEDALSIAAIVLALILVAMSIFVAISATMPAFLVAVVPWATGIGGVFIILEGIFNM